MQFPLIIILFRCIGLNYHYTKRIKLIQVFLIILNHLEILYIFYKNSLHEEAEPARKTRAKAKQLSPVKRTG